MRGAVVGTGFIAQVHPHALRSLEIDVAGVVGSSPQRARLVGHMYESYNDLLADHSFDVVHLTTPNHLHREQALKALEAGKRIVCEKPLAPTVQESAELVERAVASGRTHCTNFNLRFYLHVQQAREINSAGAIGDVWNAHGYYRDSLLLPSDWNWHLEPARGDLFRAVADIGSHWLHLVEYVTGLEVIALSWDSGRPDKLWRGHRDSANETPLCDPNLLGPGAREPSSLPGGHAEGYADTFRELSRRVYQAVEAGHPPHDPNYPTFADGHRANLLADALKTSATQRSWVALSESTPTSEVH
jgi:predicted dehydrogenase